MTKKDICVRFLYMRPEEKEKYIREFLTERMEIRGASDLTNAEAALIVSLSKLSISALNEASISLLELFKIHY